MKMIKCGSIVPGCDFHTEAETEEDLMLRVAQHARKAHDISAMSPEMLARIRAAMTDVPPPSGQ